MGTAPETPRTASPPAQLSTIEYRHLFRAQVEGANSSSHGLLTGYI
ncbi:MAG TPA: hypothetical protein VGJ86_02220 [Acidimicrobiales bacterium]